MRIRRSLRRGGRLSRQAEEYEEQSEYDDSDDSELGPADDSVDCETSEAASSGSETEKFGSSFGDSDVCRDERLATEEEVDR